MFLWDDANILHIARHGVTPEEAEQALLNDPISLDPQLINGECRLPHIGATSKGRLLYVVLVEIGDDIRVVTAFEPGSGFKRLYANRKDL